MPDVPAKAVKLDLEFDGFEYRKWGGVQHAKRGDWLIDHRGEVYTIDADVFERTYREASPGLYLKCTPVWAVKASHAGRIVTHEGATEYQAGDYLVSNDEDGFDSYAIGRAQFELMYEPDD